LRIESDDTLIVVADKITSPRLTSLSHGAG